MFGRIVKISLAAGLAALLLGMYLGNKVPYGAKKLSMTEAVARLQDRQTGLVLADEKDGDKQFVFHVAVNQFQPRAHLVGRRVGARRRKPALPA